MIKNAYIHIPFCRQKCYYCSFVSFPQLEKKDCYLEALLKEIEYRYMGENLSTIYFGGGTPSLLSVEDFSKILGLFKFNRDCEVTVEINPETIDEAFLPAIKDLGVNRLSFGCQTFDEDILKSIGRKHTPEQLIRCVKQAQNLGFKNINLDFIYGLPTQTIEGFEKDLIKASDLGVEHISLYGLKIEEGCFFYEHSPNELPDLDTQADMYLKAIETLGKRDFEHYEISNFAKKSFESAHNLNYWNNNSYYGFGVSAHGYDGKVRYSNVLNIEDYVANPLRHDLEHELTVQEQLEEEIFLGFRKMKGIAVDEINKKFSIDFEHDYSDILQKYLSLGYLVQTEQGYRFSNEGILLSNVILADFLQ